MELRTIGVVLSSCFVARDLCVILQMILEFTKKFLHLHQLINQVVEGVTGSSVSGGPCFFIVVVLFEQLFFCVFSINRIGSPE